LRLACRLLGLVGVVAFAAVAFTPLCDGIYEASRANETPLQPGSAIVALGSGVSAGGMLSARSLRRTIYAVRLYHRGLAPLLVLLGPSRGRGSEEALLRAELAREMGVPPQAVLTDSGGRTTDEEAARMKALLSPRGIRKIVLVTGFHHMPRARQLFAGAGFDVVAAPMEEIQGVSSQPGDRIGLARTLLQEFLARQYYRMRGGP
jgi:uncharacterized SAM-binding protein YcdF (DUF218 family)